MTNLSVRDVEGGYSLHVQLLCMLCSCILSIIGSIEVLATHAALGARHVTPNDEVRAACQHHNHCRLLDIAANANAQNQMIVLPGASIDKLDQFCCLLFSNAVWLLHHKHF